MKDSTDSTGAWQRALGWVALGTALLLLIPFVAMRLTNEVDWSGSDFFLMGVLLLGAGSAAALAARRVPRRRRFLVVAVIALAFVFVWAELGVGVFTGLGS